MFEDPEISSRITGDYQELVKCFKVILKMISTGYDVESAKFYRFVKITVKIYVDLYD